MIDEIDKVLLRVEIREVILRILCEDPNKEFGLMELTNAVYTHREPAFTSPILIKEVIIEMIKNRGLRAEIKVDLGWYGDPEKHLEWETAYAEKRADPHYEESEDDYCRTWAPGVPVLWEKFPIRWIHLF